MASSFNYEKSPGTSEQVELKDNECKVLISDHEILILTDVSVPSSDVILATSHAEVIPALYDNEVINPDPHYVPVYIFDNNEPRDFSPHISQFRYLGPTE